MLFLVALASIRQQMIRIQMSSFKRIVSTPGLRGACDRDNQSITTRITNSNVCKDYDLSFNTFTGITSSTYGGAVYIYYIDIAILKNNTFIKNKINANYHGGTIYFHTVKKINVFGNMINESSCNGYGGSIYIEKPSDIEIIANSFDNSFCGDYGGACCIYYHTTLAIKGNYFSDCHASGTTAKYGGAIYIESASPVNLAQNTIKNCFADSYGGAVSFINSNKISSSNNTFHGDYTKLDNSYTGSKGGALYLQGITTSAQFLGDSFSECYAKDNGCGFYVSGPVSLEIIFNDVHFDKCKTPGNDCSAIYFNNLKKVEMTGIECNDCNSSNLGGAIDFDGVKDVKITTAYFNNCAALNLGGAIHFTASTPSNLSYISFSNCFAITGGAIFYGSTSPVIISHVTFNTCSSYMSGGAIYTEPSEKLEILYSKFINCSSITASGGGVFATMGTFAAIIKNNEFTSCKSLVHGSSICILASTISYVSENNIFSDSEGGTSSGAVMIESIQTNLIIPLFSNDGFINCGTKDTGKGGAINLKFGKNAPLSLQFNKCIFHNCSASNSGAIRLDVIVEYAITVEIKIRGCDFKDCKATEASCIGISHSEPPIITLDILDIGENKTVFREMTSQSNNYAIVAGAGKITLSNVDFRNLVSIGGINATAKCKELKIFSCNFIGCKSSGNIINGKSLDTYNVKNSLFQECKNCFSIISSSIELTSNSFESIEEHTTPSELAGSVVNIFDFNISDSRESIVIKSNKVTFDKGKFIDFKKNIAIIKGAIATSEPVTVTVDHLTAENSQMFQIGSEINSFTMTNSQGSYGNTEPEAILKSNAYKTTITNSKFTRSGALSLVFDSGDVAMSFCNISGDGPNIKFGTQIKLDNCIFDSNINEIFYILAPNGKLVLVSDSNCINKQFDEAFSSKGTKNVFNENGVKIEGFSKDNNRCYFPPTEIFSSSEIFRATDHFSDSADFIKSNVFSRTKMFIETDLMTFSNQFSVSKSFIKEQVTTVNNEDTKSSYLFKDTSSKYIINPVISETIKQNLTFKYSSHYQKEATYTSHLLTQTNIEYDGGLTSQEISETDGSTQKKNIFTEDASKHFDVTEINGFNEIESSIPIIENIRATITSNERISIKVHSQNLGKNTETYFRDTSRTFIESHQKHNSENFNEEIVKSSLYRKEREISQQKISSHEATFKYNKATEIQDGIRPSSFQRYDIEPTKEKENNVSNSLSKNHIHKTANQIQIPNSSKTQGKIIATQSLTLVSKPHKENNSSESRLITKKIEINSSALKTPILKTETRKLPANKPSSLKLAQSTIKQNEDARTLVSIRDIDYHYDPEDNVAEQQKQTSTGMVAGIVVGIIVVVVVSLVLVYLLVSKKTDPDEDSDCLNDNETEFETSNSTESFDEYGTTYVTQENTNTIWGTDQKETDIGFFNDDFEEVECFN